MSNSTGESWPPNNPYAPNITHRTYLAEKMNFAGFLIGSVLYGIVVVLFYHCMVALLNPVNRAKQGIKWGLVAHTTAMFSFVTVYTSTNLVIQSLSYIDNREFPGSPEIPPGPLGWQIFIASKPISVVTSIAFVLNNWLADGLLLYRCYITYSMNYWIIAFPFLMYIVSFATGIGLVYEGARPVDLTISAEAIAKFGTIYYSISLSINVILTLMIVLRLVLHSRNVRNAMGAPGSTGGLYSAVVTMLVESCALYAITYLLFMAPWAAQSYVTNAFFPILAETQVIAPFLIILRVARQRALTSEAIVSGNFSSLRFAGQSQGKTAYGNGTIGGGHPSNSMSETYGRSPNDLVLGVVTTIDLPHDKV